MSKRGNRPSWTACRVIEKAPVMTAWLAITVAAVVSKTSGHNAQLGHMRKNGFSIAAGRPRTSAPCPR